MADIFYYLETNDCRDKNNFELPFLGRDRPNPQRDFRLFLRDLKDFHFLLRMTLASNNISINYLEFSLDKP
jgi:hypothetical protein